MRIPIFNNFSLSRLLYNKKFTIPFSISMAFIFWLIIMISQNPVRAVPFAEVPVSISIENTVASEMGLDIVTDISNLKFTVTLNGPSYIVSSLKAEDFIIYASATDVNAPGNYTLEVAGQRNSNKSGYTFSNISPSTIDVAFDYFDAKEYTITPRLVGVSVADGLVADNPVVTTNNQQTSTNLKIRGPRTTMDKISSVIAYYEVNKTLSTTQTFDANIKLYDVDGKEIDQTGLTMAFKTVKVSQPISKKVTVSIKPLFTNLPAGITIPDISYKIDHSSVTIIGSPDAVNQLTSINLSAIDFFNVSPSSNTFEVSPNLPDGIKIIENISFFTVSVNTSAYSEKTFNISNVNFVDLASGLNAKSTASIRNVRICGPADVIKKLKASDVYAEINLNGKSAGEHTVTVTIKSQEYNKIWQAGTYTTTVTIN